VVRSRKRKATKPELRGRDKSTVSERQGGAAMGEGQGQESHEGIRVSRGITGSRWSDEVRAEGRVSKNYGGRDSSIEKHNHDDGLHASYTGGKVSFYIMNFPGYMLLYRLRQFFEVRGMLFDVYVARYRNVREQFLGFVQFVNVKNSGKLSQALNNVWIGDCRVWAREARFDRFAQFDDEPRANLSGVREEEVFGKGREAFRKRGEGKEKIKRERNKAEGKRVGGEKRWETRRGGRVTTTW